jgi:hypothetical protein
VAWIHIIQVVCATSEVPEAQTQVQHCRILGLLIIYVTRVSRINKVVFWAKFIVFAQRKKKYLCGRHNGRTCFGVSFTRVRTLGNSIQKLLTMKPDRVGRASLSGSASICPVPVAAITVIRTLTF